eukprot:GHVQ01028040.1.p1 GENE.GHVQ01028040.1~~GHVQ01028040.1.p1  ORF type:complete len:101 (-),score=8.90 GHVQ01028040.1:445-747(-)
MTAIRKSVSNHGIAGYTHRRRRVLAENCKDRRCRVLAEHCKDRRCAVLLLAGRLLVCSAPAISVIIQHKQVPADCRDQGLLESLKSMSYKVLLYNVKYYE